jgi:hypothetical protein
MQNKAVIDLTGDEAPPCKRTRTDEAGPSNEARDPASAAPETRMQSLIKSKHDKLDKCLGKHSKERAKNGGSHMTPFSCDAADWTVEPNSSGTVVFKYVPTGASYTSIAQVDSVLKGNVIIGVHDVEYLKDVSELMKLLTTAMSNWCISMARMRVYRTDK